MRPLEVVMPQPRPEGAGTSPRAGIGHGIRPASNQGLNKALGLAVGLWAIGPRARQPHARAGGTLLKAAAHIRAAVIGQDPLHDDAATSEPLNGASEKPGRRRARLLRQHFD